MNIDSCERAEASQKEEEKWPFKRVVKVSLFVIAATMLVNALLASILGASGIERAGAFGDLFGFSNAIFSGIGLTAVAYALLQQNKALALQRTEMDQNVQSQNKMMKAQQEELEAHQSAIADSTESRKALVEAMLLSALVEATPNRTGDQIGDSRGHLRAKLMDRLGYLKKREAEREWYEMAVRSITHTERFVPHEKLEQAIEFCTPEDARYLASAMESSIEEALLAHPGVRLQRKLDHLRGWIDDRKLR